MRFFINHSVFAMYTLTTLMFAQGKVREADALTHKPNVLKPSPTSGATNAWSPNHRWNHRFAKSTTTVHRFTPRQQEQSQRSMEMRMAHGNIGIDKPKNIPSVPLLVASALTLALVFKTKTILALFQTPGWFFANMLYKPYQNALVSNPLVTKVLTGATLALTGDAAAQATSKMGYDKRRAISFAMFDSCYRVFQHNCFPLIIKLGQGNFIGKILPAFFLPAAAAIEQTLMYQFVIVPILYYPIFFTFTGSIQGLSLQQSVDRMKRQFLPCWKKNLMFWIPTQMVLFGLVAEKWQIPFACLMGTLWSMLLSNFAGDSKKK